MWNSYLSQSWKIVLVCESLLCGLCLVTLAGAVASMSWGSQGTPCQGCLGGTSGGESGTSWVSWAGVPRCHHSGMAGVQIGTVWVVPRCSAQKAPWQNGHGWSRHSLVLARALHMGPLLRWLEPRLPWARCALECLGPRLPWRYGWSCSGHRLRGALHQCVLAGTAITGMSAGGGNLGLVLG